MEFSTILQITKVFHLNTYYPLIAKCHFIGYNSELCEHL